MVVYGRRHTWARDSNSASFFVGDDALVFVEGLCCGSRLVDVQLGLLHCAFALSPETIIAMRDCRNAATRRWLQASRVRRWRHMRSALAMSGPRLDAWNRRLSSVTCHELAGMPGSARSQACARLGCPVLGFTVARLGCACRPLAAARRAAATSSTAANRPRCFRSTRNRRRDLALQVALDRAGFSPGEIDARSGLQHRIARWRPSKPAKAADLRRATRLP